MKNILITGITGFLGKSLVKYFHGNSEYKIYGNSRGIDKATALFHDVDIEFIPELTSESLDEHEIDIIVHLAGIAHDLSGNYVEADYNRVNFLGTKALYRQFLDSKTTTFVFVSSIKAAVDHSEQVIDENINPNPSSAYGISKLKAEEYIIKNSIERKRSYILRPCMVHGPGNKGNLNLLYRFVEKGLPYPLGDFQNKRSFLSVENFCFVIQKILEEQLKAGTYHLSDKEQLSTKELVRLIGDTIGKKSKVLSIPKPIIYTMAKIGNIFQLPFNQRNIDKLTEDLVVSNRKLLLNLGTDLPVSAEEGLIKTIKSFNE